MTHYLQAGGTLGLIGSSGVRDENNLPRPHPPLEQWRKAGRVVELLLGRTFLPNRTVENEQTRELTRLAIGLTRAALNGETILSGDLPRMLWVKAWRHGGEFVSFHFVNYDINFESGAAAPTEPLSLTVSLPDQVSAEEAAWLTPDGKGQAVPVASERHGGALRGGRKVTVTLPSVRVYGVVVIGRRGLDEKRSALMQGEALLARAEMAADGNGGALADQAAAVREAGQRCREQNAAGQEGRERTLRLSFVDAAEQLLSAVQQAQDEAYLERLRQAAAAEGEPRAFDFGGAERKVQGPWRSVGAESRYSPAAGFGWLPPAALPIAKDKSEGIADHSVPTPEETYYAMAHRYGGKIATEITASRLLFWPYREQPPKPLRTNLGCGASQRFRVDVPIGQYTVRVVTTNPSWTNRNFLVSGMVSVNGASYLLDTVHDRGALAAREFAAPAPQGKLTFTFGGPTGWAVTALMVFPSGQTKEDPQAARGLREWRVSRRYANPDWYPITQVACPPEKRLDNLPEADWTALKAHAAGLPVVDLGANREAEVGDVVYAVTTIQRLAAGDMSLHFGSTSSAQLWLNGEPIGYVPNEKGLRRDELIAPLKLRAGKNRLVIKLQRFWERRWMFYASLTN